MTGSGSPKPTPGSLLTEARPDYVRNTSWLLGERVLRVGLVFVVGVLVARHLGPERFGRLTYATSLVWLFAAVASVGLDDLLVREIVDRPSDGPRLLGSGLAVRLGGGVIAGCGAMATSFLLGDDPATRSLVAVLVATLLLQPLRVFDSWFQAKVRWGAAGRSHMASRLASAALAGVLIAVDAPLIGFAAIPALEGLVLGSLLVLGHRRDREGGARLGLDGSVARRLVRDGWPLAFSGVVVAVFMRSDQLMLEKMLGPVAVGQYAAAARLSEGFTFLPAAITASFFPAILQARATSRPEYLRRLQLLYEATLASAVVIAASMTLFASPLIELLYGGAFGQSAAVLVVHVWTGIFTFYGLAKSRWVLAENLQRFGLVCAASGAAVNVGLNSVLIPRFGPVGAAYATILAMVTSAVLLPLAHPVDRRSVAMLARAVVPLELVREGLARWRGRG